MTSWLLGDFHVHSNVSDGVLSPIEIVDLFAKGGIEVLNFSDHLHETVSERGKQAHRAGKTIRDWQDYSKIIEEARAYAEITYGMHVIRGAEITNYIQGFHIVAIDLHDPVDPNLAPEKILREIHVQGALTVAAHPYPQPHAPDRGYVFHLYDYLPLFRNLADLWEIGNGNVLYEDISREDLRFIADSDFHFPKQFYSWKTLVRAPKNTKAIKQALLDQKIAITKIHP